MNVPARKPRLGRSPVHHHQRRRRMGTKSGSSHNTSRPRGAGVSHPASLDKRRRQPTASSTPYHQDSMAPGLGRRRAADVFAVPLGIQSYQGWVSPCAPPSRADGYVSGTSHCTGKKRNDTTCPPVKRHAWFVVGILHLVRSVFPFQSVRQHHVVRPLAPTADPHYRPTPPPPPSLQRSSPASPKAPSPDRDTTLPQKRPSWCRAPGPPPSAPARGQSP